MYTASDVRDLTFSCVWEVLRFQTREKEIHREKRRREPDEYGSFTHYPLQHRARVSTSQSVQKESCREQPAEEEEEEEEEEKAGEGEEREVRVPGQMAFLY
ncbi:unnamed protein product [Boreogadus saida]